MNNRSAVLILSYMVISVLTILGAAFFTGSISESRTAKHYCDSTRAFWAAEAGLAEAYQNWINGNAQPAGQVDFGSGAYSIDSSNMPDVEVSGTFSGAQRNVRASFVRVPLAFDNTLSVGRNLSLSGLLARIEVYDKTRISGAYSKSLGTSDWFEDKQVGVSQDSTTIRIPDYNNNGVSDEFGDFVQFGRKAVQDYSADEIVYIQNNGTVNIFPNQALVGKKVIFVEGAAPGQGNVNIFFDATWQDNQDITVIATGTVSYVQPLQFQSNARLSTFSWGDYNEAAIFRSEHESVVYTHEDANFIDILDWGSTTGNIIANRDVSLREVLTYEKYFFSDRARNGDLPPGLKWLPGAGTTGFTHLADWEED